MGPINIALVKLFQADEKLRQAQGRLDSISKNVRIQERRVADLSERLRLGQATLKEQQSQTAQLDLDLKTRETKIERLRAQQQNSKNNREYQAFLVEINTEKVDKGKSEEELLKIMASVEKLQTEVKELTGSVDAETSRLKSMRAEIGERVKELQAEIDSLHPVREAAAAGVTPQARQAFERLAERFEGEAMSALTKPDKRREEYACSACNMDLVTDVYNRLHSRDELVFCPSCHRILYIPDDLPVETAVHKVKERKEPRTKTSNLKAAIGRQTAAEDVVKSITIEEDEPESPPPPTN
ncbi:MAG: C4-type zinc ribbon domain-containing protein [Tepidisphaeraceae bacterium]|jgi:predicted  nucleic acid-binding Zn-ribbon protein